MKCNKCSKVINNNSDYLEVEKCWGYESSKDLDTHKFKLCEQCYDKMVNSFVIPVDIEEYDPSKKYFC